MRDLKPCPFCGSTSLADNWSTDGFGEGVISCSCGASMRAKTENECYTLIGGDIYKRIPMKQGKDLVLERWNRRTKWT